MNTVTFFLQRTRKFFFELYFHFKVTIYYYVGQHTEPCSNVHYLMR
jgi:hypothetical protein